MVFNNRKSVNAQPSVFYDIDTVSAPCSGHQIKNIVLKAYKIESVLSVHVQMVFQFLACLVKKNNKCKVSACFFEK